MQCDDYLFSHQRDFWLSSLSSIKVLRQFRNKLLMQVDDGLILWEISCEFVTARFCGEKIRFAVRCILSGLSLKLLIIIKNIIRIYLNIQKSILIFKNFYKKNRRKINQKTALFLKLIKFKIINYKYILKIRLFF